jgi:hypothetical protein
VHPFLFDVVGTVGKVIKLTHRCRTLERCAHTRKVTGTHPGIQDSIRVFRRWCCNRTPRCLTFSCRWVRCRLESPQAAAPVGRAHGLTDKRPIESSLLISPPPPTQRARPERPLDAAVPVAPSHALGVHSRCGSVLERATSWTHCALPANSPSIPSGAIRGAAAPQGSSKQGNSGCDRGDGRGGEGRNGRARGHNGGWPGVGAQACGVPWQQGATVDRQRECGPGRWRLETQVGW